VDGLTSWLAEVFGPSETQASEPWYSAIETIELGTTGAGEPAVVVWTTLTEEEAVTAGQADLVALAVSRSQLTFAGDVEVWYADGAGRLSVGIGGYDPYVY
jgi:hypothetical protein